VKLLLSFLLSAAIGLGKETEAPPQTTAEILRHEELELSVKLKAIQSANVTAELDAAIKRGDQRFFDLTGFGAVPGVENWNLKLEKQYGTMVVGSGFGMLIEDDQEKYETALAEYAATYNRQLFARIGEESDPPEDLSKLPLDKRIDTLISRLVLSEDNGKGVVFTPSKRTLPSDRRMIAFNAADELTKIGYPAFPKLVASLEDRRQSVTMGRYNRSDVGMACRVILRSQIYSFPEGYAFGFFRKGADGKEHENSYYADRDFFGNDLGAWIMARKDKSLLGIQIEVLTWVVERERDIGAATEEDRQGYIVPLEKRLDELKRALETTK
jgi:hypothetical protein